MLTRTTELVKAGAGARAGAKVRIGAKVRAQACDWRATWSLLLLVLVV